MNKIKTLIEKFKSLGYIANMMNDDTVRIGIKESEIPNYDDVFVLKHLTFIKYENGNYKLEYGDSNLLK